MYILMGEEKGDYDDYYTRSVSALKISKDKQKLIDWWEKHPVGPESEEYPNTRILFQNIVFVDYYIAKIEEI